MDKSCSFGSIKDFCYVYISVPFYVFTDWFIWEFRPPKFPRLVLCYLKPPKALFLACLWLLSLLGMVKFFELSRHIVPLILLLVWFAYLGITTTDYVVDTLSSANLCDKFRLLLCIRCGWCGIPLEDIVLIAEVHADPDGGWLPWL